MNVRSYVHACYLLILDIICEICAIILSAKNFKMKERCLHEVPFPCSFPLWCMSSGICTCSRDQTTSTGTVISTFVCTYCTGLGFQANIVEEYMLLSALLHIFAGLKRTQDQKLSSGLMSGQLSLAITGLMLLMFMTIHLSQLRFADTEQYFLRHQPLSIGGQVDVLLD